MKKPIAIVAVTMWGGKQSKYLDDMVNQVLESWFNMVVKRSNDVTNGTSLDVQ